MNDARFHNALGSLLIGTCLGALGCSGGGDSLGQSHDPDSASQAAMHADGSATQSGESSDDPSPEAVVQRQLEAYNARDIDAFMATFHAEAELFGIGETEARAQGHAAVRRLYADLFERSPELHSELVHRAVIGSKVVDHERIDGRQGGEILELVMVYEVEDGKIRRAWSVK